MPSSAACTSASPARAAAAAAQTAAVGRSGESEARKSTCVSDSSNSICTFSQSARRTVDSSADEAHVPRWFARHQSTLTLKPRGNSSNHDTVGVDADSGSARRRGPHALVLGLKDRRQVRAPEVARVALTLTGIDVRFVVHSSRTGNVSSTRSGLWTVQKTRAQGLRRRLSRTLYTIRTLESLVHSVSPALKHTNVESSIATAVGRCVLTEHWRPFPRIRRATLAQHFLELRVGRGLRARRACGIGAFLSERARIGSDAALESPTAARSTRRVESDACRDRRPSAKACRRRARSPDVSFLDTHTPRFPIVSHTR